MERDRRGSGERGVPLGYVGDLVCEPAEHIVEHAEWWCAGRVDRDETHAHVEHGIARCGVDVAGIRLCEELENVEELCEGEIWGGGLAGRVR